MRVVLDTNVLVAAFIARGVCADILERTLNDHELQLSPHLLEELERVMSVKLGFDPSRVERALALLRRIGRAVEPEALEAPVCRDRDDDQILALARSSGAACLVTGDDDLLTLREFEGIPILSPRGFLAFNE